MSEENKKRVIILIGPPGSGKGTQAELLAEKFGLFHLETSKLVEDAIKEADPNDEEFTAAQKAWSAGKLVESKTIVRLTLDKIKNIAESEKGLVLSGSPRTLYEIEKELPSFENLYGRDNIRVFNIKLSEEESVKRNSFRRICKASRHPIPNFSEFKDIKVCLKDGSEIITRALDNPEVIKVRYNTYLEETEPVIGFLRNKGYRIIEINGEQPIDKIFEDILSEVR
jgi:adenylate kinase